MYKVGIIGHSLEDLNRCDFEYEFKLSHILSLIKEQYDNVVFNIIGNTGIGMYSGNQLQLLNYKYHVFLPFQLSKTYKNWYFEQQEQLKKICYSAFSITTCYNEEQEDRSYEFLINDSNFIIAFWIGKKQGKTYDAIKYALKNNKIVLNAFKDLSMITNQNIL